MAELRVKGTGTIKLFENDNTSSVTIASPASLSADKTITLPDADVTLASGTMLATDGSGASLTALNATQLTSGTVPAARLSGVGKILQMQTMTYGTSESTTSTSYVDSSITDSITPASSSNQVLVLCGVPNYCNKTGGADAGTRSRMKIAIYRGTASGTLLQECAVGYNIAGGTTDTGFTMETMATFAYVDSPSTTSAQTYTMCYRVIDGNWTGYVNNDYGSDAVSNIVLLEIDGT